jgi:hypothetical protein
MIRYERMDLHFNPLEQTVLINISLKAEKFLIFLMLRDGAMGTAWFEGRGKSSTVSSRKDGVVSNTK